MEKPVFELGQTYTSDMNEKSPREKMELMDSVAYKKEESVYSRSLTPEELANAKDKLAKSAIRIAKIQEQKKEAMDDFKAALKEEGLIYDEFLHQVKYGSVNLEGILFNVDDQESGLMGIFDDRGICVNVRALLPEERQGVIRMEQRKAN